MKLWYIILDGDGEPSHLMSSMEYVFCVCAERFPKRIEGRLFYCGECVESMSKE